MPSVNPKILIWARETAGLEPEAAVKKLGINDARGIVATDRLAALEAGTIFPSRPMLLKMSKQYRRPLLTFYLSVPPRRGDRGEDFRTLPDTVAVTDKALADVVVRDIRARQSLVRNLLEEEDEADQLNFVGSASIEDGVASTVKKIMSQLQFDLNYYRNQNNIDKAFAYFRECAEASGVFVLLVDNLGSFHSEVSVEAFRGFALADDVAPFVAINSNDSKGALSFTLAHELAHIWLGLTGISGRASQRRVETFCNNVAGEILLPTAELIELEISSDTAFDTAKLSISSFAASRHVSSTMVAYKLLKSDAYQYDYFSRLSSAFRDDFLSQRTRTRDRGRQTDGGPTYPTIRRHRAGTALVGLVDRMLGSGAITTTKAGKVLGVSGKNVHGVLGNPRRRQSA